MADTGSDAAAAAAAAVADVRNDPAARVALLRATYESPGPATLGHRRFCRAALSFAGWEVRRGVLAPPTAPTPGSPWWRAVNERLLRDGCEAAARGAGLGGEPSSETIEPWMRFIAEPSARHWYRAHNGSIATAYLDHRDLAERENRAERFFINVVLLRVLYAHALVDAPHLVPVGIRPLGRALGDPRLGMAGIFMSLRRTVPGAYPLLDPLESYLPREEAIGRILDYTVIRPRLQHLYEWSARTLETPGLASLLDEGAPVYAWPVGDRALFERPLRHRRRRGPP